MLAQDLQLHVEMVSGGARVGASLYNSSLSLCVGCTFAVKLPVLASSLRFYKNSHFYMLTSHFPSSERHGFFLSLIVVVS